MSRFYEYMRRVFTTGRDVPIPPPTAANSASEEDYTTMDFGDIGFTL